MALAAFSADFAGARNATSKALFAAGSKLDGDASAATCDCYSKCTSEMMAMSSTPAPTPEEFWTIYFSDGSDTESYVWTMESTLEEIMASVLVDMEGYVTGVAVDKNGTTAYFVEYTGSVYKVNNDGYGLTELYDACWGVGDSCAGQHHYLGMDVYEQEESVFFCRRRAGQAPLAPP